MNPTIKATVFPTAVSILICLVFTLQSCVHPGGDIGEYFGNWVLEKIEIDSDDHEAYEEPIFLSFQSNVFNMSGVDQIGVYGIWEEDDNRLSLHADPDSGIVKRFPRIMGWGDTLDVTLLILEKNSRRLRLQWDATDGKIWTYSFRKIIGA